MAFLCPWNKAHLPWLYIQKLQYDLLLINFFNLILIGSLPISTTCPRYNASLFLSLKLYSVNHQYLINVIWGRGQENKQKVLWSNNLGNCNNYIPLLKERIMKIYM